MADAPRTKDPSQNVLWVAATPEGIASDVRTPVDEVRRLIESGRRKMIEARRARPTPGIDRNILSDWNGMMVSSYLKAYETLGDEDVRGVRARNSGLSSWSGASTPRPACTIRCLGMSVRCRACWMIR